MSKIIISKDNLYGVINELGEIIIEPYYDDIREFSNGVAAVCKDSKWGYIDQKGNQLTNLLYDKVKDFTTYGVAAIKRQKSLNSWALIKDNGQIIEPPNGDKYYHIYDFNSYGYAIVRRYSDYRIIDIKGNYANDDSYSSLEYIEDQKKFIGDKMGNLCLINIEGQTVVDPDNDYDMIYYPTNGLCLVEKDGKYGYIDEEGKEVIPLQYEDANEFAENGLAFVKFDHGLGGYINKEGDIVIEPKYDTGSIFRFGMAAVSKDGKYIFIYENGNQSINHTFKYAGAFAECGLAKTELFDGRQEFIRPDSSIALRLKRGCELREFIGSKKITTFKVDGRVALINSEGEIFTGLNYDEVEISWDSDLHPFLKNGLWGYIDNDGNIVIDNIYQRASTFTEGNLAKVKAFYPFNDENAIELYINDKDEIIDTRIIKMFNKSFADFYSQVNQFYDGMALATKKKAVVELSCYGEDMKKY